MTVLDYDAELTQRQKGIVLQKEVPTEAVCEPIPELKEEVRKLFEAANRAESLAMEQFPGINEPTLNFLLLNHLTAAMKRDVLTRLNGVSEADLDELYLGLDAAAALVS